MQEFKEVILDHEYIDVIENYPINAYILENIKIIPDFPYKGMKEVEVDPNIKLIHFPNIEELGEHTELGIPFVPLEVNVLSSVLGFTPTLLITTVLTPI